VFLFYPFVGNIIYSAMIFELLSSSASASAVGCCISCKLPSVSNCSKLLGTPPVRRIYHPRPCTFLGRPGMTVMIESCIIGWSFPEALASGAIASTWVASLVLTLEALLNNSSITSNLQISVLITYLYMSHILPSLKRQGSQHIFCRKVLNLTG